jgi:outer membrane lipoprotein SlyB
MNFVRIVSALALLGGVGGCYPTTQSSYEPAVWEQPQHVDFFYGTLVSIRPAQIAYGGPAGFGLRARWSPWLAGLSAEAGGPSGGFGATAAGVGVFFEASIPNVPAKEYTVMLDHGINPADPYLNPRSHTGAIIVVQNVYPFEGEPGVNTRVAVRVVGNSARVIANPLPPFAEALLAAAAPMPVPLQGPPAAAPPPPVESYGYRQALYQHWSIEP